MSFSGVGESAGFRSGTRTTKPFSLFQGFVSGVSPVRQRGGDARVPSAPAQSGGRARASAGREPPSACGHEPRGEEPLLIRTPFRGLAGCDPGSRGDGALGMLLWPRSVAVLLVLIWGLPSHRHGLGSVESCAGVTLHSIRVVGIITVCTCCDALQPCVVTMANKT